MADFSKSKRITVAEMAPHVHYFRPDENKAEKIYKWLSQWIKNSLKCGKVKPYDFLPSKQHLAFHTSVSIGTMQNAYRMLEDEGLVLSKQKIGTFILPAKNDNCNKLTSKRDYASELIKNFIVNFGLKINDSLPSTRKLGELLQLPPTTIRSAINKLIANKIIEKKGRAFIILNTKFKVNKEETKTLVDKIADKINKYIKKNIKSGQKLPSENTLADMYNVSVKTVHDAVYILSAAGIVETRRGYYGTIVSKKDEEHSYFYEQVQLKIKKYIYDNCKVNDKLPTIKQFAEIFNVSTKTIKKALDNLSEDGYISFLRGRNGGTFVTDIPALTEQGYAWLALSPEFEQKFN